MKKVLFGIFAHPDDEAFGPSAYLYSEAQTGTDVHLLLITDGENGNNPDSSPDLAAVRLKEWHKSGTLIGATSQIAFHYPDGGLCNNLYTEVADTLLRTIKNILKGYSAHVVAEIITYENGGLTGHLDHIAVSYITTYVYLKLRDVPPPNITMGRLKYFCLPRCVAPTTNTSWLFMECGAADAECDELFDYADIVNQKRAIMQAHYSQRDDMKAILAQQEQTASPCKYRDHFRYFKDS